MTVTGVDVAGRRADGGSVTIYSKGRKMVEGNWIQLLAAKVVSESKERSRLRNWVQLRAGRSSAKTGTKAVEISGSAAGW